MTLRPEADVGNEQDNPARSRRRLLWAGAGVILLAVAILWLWPAKQPVIDAPVAAPKTKSARKPIKNVPEASPKPLPEIENEFVESVEKHQERNFDSEPETNAPKENLPDAQAELESALIETFKVEAMETLPLLTLHTADPLQPDRPGPKPGEVWIRINAGNSSETRDIMVQVADLYRTTLKHENPVTVMLWVGGQPMARFEY